MLQLYSFPVKRKYMFLNIFSDKHFDFHGKKIIYIIFQL